MNLDKTSITYLLLSIISIILAIILFLTNFNYKKKLLKSEFLLSERYILIVIFNLFYIFIKWKSLNNNNSSNLNDYFSLFFFLSLIVYYINILSVNHELFKEISYPFYNFISIFNEKWKNLNWELLTICSIIIGILFNKYIKEELNASDSELKFQIVLRVNKISILLILLFYSILNIIVCLMNIFTLYNFQNPSKKKILFKIIINQIFSIILLGYIIINFISKLDYFTNKYNNLYSFYLLIIFTLDMVINMIYIKNSDFYYFTLGRKDLSSFYGIFGFNNFYKPVLKINDENEKTINTKLLSSNNEIIQKDETLYYFHKVLKFTSISQFNLEISEYYLNLSIVCISSIFDKMSQFNIEKNSGNDILIPINDECRKNLDKKGKYYEFDFNETSFNDDEKSFLIKLKNNTFDKNFENNDKFEVNIKYFHYETFTSIIKNREINISQVIKSLLSHSCNFPFLICKNCKDEYFKSMKTLSLKTNDRKYIIDIFSNILYDDSKNTILELYLNHISKQKRTFLPILFGAFKIKINNMNPFVIFISRNSIMENIPKEIFNYWQLMRFIPSINTFEKIFTSKDRTSLCITEDNLFKDNQKISINDYLNFSSILTEDIKFLSMIESKNFSLLIMYYEIDQNFDEYIRNTRNTRNTLKNRKTEFEFNKKNDDIDFRPSEIKNMKYEEITNLSNYDITFNNVNKNGNGFETKFNNINSIIFFSFEKIFEFRGFSFKSFDYYSFNRKILDYFDGNFDDNL